MADELYDIRNMLLVGNFHQVIAEGSSVRTVKKKPEEVQAFTADRDALVARAQLGLGQFDAVIAELRGATNPLLVAVRLYAEVSREMASLPLEQQSSKVQALVAAAGEQPMAALADVAVLACAGLMVARDAPAALALAHKWVAKLDTATHGRQVIELRAVIADGYLRINRPDLAEKEVVAMRDIDDEATIAIFIGGIVSLRMAAVKPERANDAAAAFQELTARCGQSVAVLNLMALANITKGNLKEAERNLLDALAKKSADPDTLANLAVIATLTNKPAETTTKYVTQARATPPVSAWAQQYGQAEKRIAQ